MILGKNKIYASELINFLKEFYNRLNADERPELGEMIGDIRKISENNIIRAI